MDKVIIVVMNRYNLYLSDPYGFNLQQVSRLRNVVNNIITHTHSRTQSCKERLKDKKLSDSDKKKICAKIARMEEQRQQLAGIFPVLEQAVERMNFINGIQ